MSQPSHGMTPEQLETFFVGVQEELLENIPRKAKERLGITLTQEEVDHYVQTAMKHIKEAWSS